MKITCALSDFDFSGIPSDLDVVLYGSNADPRRGSAGMALKQAIAREKVVPAARAWDFLSIALAVVSSDFAGHRDSSPDGWTREFELTVSVVDAPFWNANAGTLQRMLAVLSTDRWLLRFVEGGLLPQPDKLAVHPVEDCVVLLSGGLDSFIGMLDLDARGLRPFAVSQMVRGDGEKQVAFAGAIGGGLRHFQGNHNVDVPDPENPPSQRARSIVFLAYGVLMATTLSRYHAGGEVTQEMLPLLTATHFLRNSPDGTDSSDGNDDERRADKYAVLEGTLQIMGSSLFGLTTQCARCHDHKFEPFKQRDYYQLQAVLYPAFNVENWSYPKDRHLPAATSEAVRAWEAVSRDVEAKITTDRARFDTWLRENQPRGSVLFEDRFDDPHVPLASAWSNSVPGDQAPAGQPGVNLDSSSAPGAMNAEGRLRIVESGDDGDRAFSTQRAFDWTPDAPGGWIQTTFDLVEAGDDAPYVAYFVALRDFNDQGASAGGNVLIDGARDGQATVHVDYPGADARSLGKVGNSGYRAGSNYGVRLTNRGEGKFELAQLVNGVPEEGIVTLTADDLPDGGFGFEYCCGRSFTIDNVLIESSDGSPAGLAAEQVFAAEQARRQQALSESIAALESQRGEPLGQLAFAADLAPEPPKTPLLERGDYKSPKEWVEGAAPAMVSEPNNPAELNALADERSTGRRLAFAQWLTRPDSRAAGLLARVTVNRWWAHHFGVGIVATPENLGYSGAPPTHPELLEFLSAEFVQNGWSAKALHRLILHSAVYRQTSRPELLSLQLDPDARLLSRYPLRRLDAEAIRDAMLAVSGDLDQSQGGPYVPTDRAEDGDVVVAREATGALRRSIYLQQRRTQVLGMLDVFDAPSLVTNCTQRVQTTIPLQSLKLLNSDFVRERASSLAKRTAQESGDDAATRLQRLYLLTVGRPSTDAERQSSLEFLQQQPADYPDQTNAEELAWADLCQALLASNAFLYIH